MAPADAHPYLVRAEPAPGSTLATAPKELRLLFTERLDGPYCTVTVVGSGGERVRAAVQVHGTSLVATLRDLRPGSYRLEWSVIGDDGHRVEGEYGLAVGTGNTATASAVAGHASPQTANRALRAVLVVFDMALAALVLFHSGDENSTRTRVLVMRTVWVAASVLACVGVAQAWADGSVGSTVTGRLALQRLFATLALFPIVFDLLRRPWPRRVYGAAGVVVLLASVALAGHAFAASTGRTAQVVVLTVHLVAASVWLAALVALLVGTAAKRLVAPVAIAIAVVVVTGVFNAHVQLGGARELLTSAYGRVLDAKVALVLVMIVLGVAAAVWRRWEMAVAVCVLALAGVLGQLPNPVSVPAFSQRHPLPAGSPVITTSTGSSLLTVAMSPGRTGLNRVVASVQRPDANDIPITVAGVAAIDVAGACDCGAQPVKGQLRPVDASGALAGALEFPRAGRWTLRLAAPDGTAVVDIDVVQPPSDNEVVVGVPADLSGPDAGRCQDQVVGMQVAAAEVNERAVAGGKAVRVVAVDNYGPDPGASVGALRTLGAKVLASPCGPAAAVDAIERAASSTGTPVIGGDADSAPWIWPTAAPTATEGSELAEQVRRQGGTRPLVVAGAGQRQHDVAAATTAALGRNGTTAPTIDAGDPTATATRIRDADPDLVVLAVSAREAPPLLQALAGDKSNGWAPPRGAVGSTSMMSEAVASSGGRWFEEGRISVASEVSPTDGTSLNYAARLAERFPGHHPSVEGVRGYLAGWVVANVLHRAPGASPRSVREALATDLRSFRFGPTRLRWGRDTGGAERLAFFKTVFTNPMALAGLPGQVGHSGVFLGRGTFVQVTPWSN